MNSQPAFAVGSNRMRRRTPWRIAAGAVLVLSVAACGGSGSKTTTASQGDSKLAASSTTTTAAGGGVGSGGNGFVGSATLSFGGRTETFRIEPCVSATAQSIEGAGKTADGKWSLLLRVEDGTGEVTMSEVAAQMAVVFDGRAETLQVSENGSFTGSGKGVYEFKEVPFELNGTCGTLNWR